MLFLAISFLLDEMTTLVFALVFALDSAGESTVWTVQDTAGEEVSTLPP